MNSPIWKTFNYNGSGLDVLELFQGEPGVFFLDSSLHSSARGRFSFIGFDPFETFQAKGRNFFPELKEKFLPLAHSAFSRRSPFGAGLVGYLAYDLGLYLEDIRTRSVDDLKLPDCVFGFYDAVLTIDHVAGKLHICSTGLPEKRSFFQEKRAAERLENIVTRLSSGLKKNSPRNQRLPQGKNGHGPIWEHVRSNFSKKDYIGAVNKALDYIARGDIYQVNLSQRFCFDAKGREMDALKLYKSLRALSPSHFGGYLKTADACLLSSSPERFLRVRKGCVETRPMKGTRSRGQSRREDLRLKGELLRDQKERAELLMITDLERNDLGRVCDFGSVRVKEMRAIETYRTVFQATSTVEGKLKKGKDCFDVLASCFPGGSVTGCPKIRAMEIIEELEPNRRGVYTGALGYIGFNGEMDMNILIRTLLMHREKIYFHVGGGIVADSVPEKEYEETLIKAGAMGSSLGETFGLNGRRSVRGATLP